MANGAKSTIRWTWRCIRTWSVRGSSCSRMSLSGKESRGRTLSVMMKHGDFTGLADDYAKFRPGYARQVATALLSYVGREAASVDAADIGAGTGIWTRTLAA